MISGTPLAGRDGELTAIRHALGGGGNTAGVVIVGSAGVGKTRLAREVLARAERAGERTNWIVGTESARALPLGAFTALLGDAMADPMANVRRVINSFVAQQQRGRVLIGVDDAHLLDGLSAHVVHQLAQSRGARLVVTVRSGADEPDAVTALWKDGLLARLDLEPLSAEAIAAVGAAARQARERRQPTYELACLQAAAQWGDTSWVARARELADELGLPLANAVARHTESLAADDGEGLLAASNEYLAVGDRATAADVAAQAAVAFTRVNNASVDSMQRRWPRNSAMPAVVCAPRRCGLPRASR
uniref:ATP-binding protein n=1 Tax=Mycolicibacterium pulveris TaxID=36813 RepID=UPI0027E39EFF|nr:ATP-binding protein [Mycolicibacterium pulveris]